MYAPEGAARLRRAQENAEHGKGPDAWRPALCKASALYLPSCLAISSAKFGPVRLCRSGAPDFILVRAK